MTYHSQHLDPARHNPAAFDSGEPSLDGWLREHAATADARGLSRTFVWVDDRGVVIAYYSLAAHVLKREDLPRSIGHGLPGEIPAVLLARLALDLTRHGDRLGGALLAEALGRAVAAAQLVGARFVVVDALHEKAAGFYEHHGFRRIPGTPRLLQRVKDIAHEVQSVGGQ